MALIIGYMVNVTGVPAIDELGIASSYINSAVHFSVAFFLVAKAIKSGLYLLYAIALPKFRFHMLFNFACSLILIVVICSVLGTGNPVLFYSLIPCTKGWERTFAYVEGYFVRKCRSGVFRTSVEQKLHIKIGCLVATNVEHVIERASALVEIVLGETVVSILYSVVQYPDAAGLTPFYGRAVLVLIIAFAVNWVYFTGELSIYRTHDLKKHCTRICRRALAAMSKPDPCIVCSDHTGGR